MLKKLFKLSFLPILLIPALVNTFELSAIAETSINEDRLDTVNGMPWAGTGLPFDKVVDIKDSLVGSELGKVVIDRHGEDSSLGLFKNPFVDPRPGRFVIVSLWGSKIEGCFVKIVVQSSPLDGKADLEDLVPKLMELGIGGQVLQLTINQSAKVRGFKGDYTYTEYENSTEVKHSSTWYMTDSLFAINSNGVNLLRNAPPSDIRVRLTFANGDSKIFPIGKGNVKRWQEAFGFNSSCVRKN
jgi:hypothetical protein